MKDEEKELEQKSMNLKLLTSFHRPIRVPENARTGSAYKWHTRSDEQSEKLKSY